MGQGRRRTQCRHVYPLGASEKSLTESGAEDVLHRELPINRCIIRGPPISTTKSRSLELSLGTSKHNSGYQQLNSDAVAEHGMKSLS